MLDSGKPQYPLIDAHTHVGSDLFFYLNGFYPYAQDWMTLVESGGLQGVEKFVVFPMTSHLGLNVAEFRQGRLVSEGAWEKVPYAFENRRFMEEIMRFPEASGRAFPLWMVDPSREPAGQCAALRTLHEEFPCCGLKIQATAIRSHVRNLLQDGACLMGLAEEKNWPVLIHSSVDPEDPWSAVNDILAVAETWPKVRFNLAHSCRFDRRALDRMVELPNAWSDCSAHIIHCHLAEQNHPAVAEGPHRFASDYRDPARVLADLAMAYPEKVLWGSDAPFYSYCDAGMQMMSSYRNEVRCLRQLDGDMQRRIGRDNTLAFLGPDAEAGT